MERKQHNPSYTAFELAELNYRYLQISHDISKEPIDYGTGELYTPAEVHIVTRVELNPGITVTQIAEATLRTKSAVSQMVTKLEKKGLLRREKDPANGKQQLLYVTPKGLQLSRCHRAYDEQNVPMADLTALFGADAVDKYIKMMDYLIQYYTHNRQQSKSKENED